MFRERYFLEELSENIKMEITEAIIDIRLGYADVETYKKELMCTILYGPVGSNHGNLQNPPLLVLGYRALQELTRCTVRV